MMDNPRTLLPVVVVLIVHIDLLRVLLILVLFVLDLTGPVPLVLLSPRLLPPLLVLEALRLAPLGPPVLEPDLCRVNNSAQKK